MKRTTFAVSFLVLALSLGLASCDAMFSNNLFSKMTHPTPTVDELSQKTTTELASFVESDANLQTLAGDQALKTAALENLQTTFTTSGDSAEVQLAAQTYAKIEIDTVPSAVKFTGSLLGSLAGGSAPSSPEAAISLIKGALSSDVLSSLSSGASTPPAGFTDMIDAFLGANAAYEALGTSVKDSGGYVSGASESEKNEIAVNAVVSALVSSVSGATDEAKEQALWDALRDPANASTYVGSSMDIDALTGTGAPLKALIDASGLGSLMN